MRAKRKLLPRSLYKMATRAWHKLLRWKMSSLKPELCHVVEEDRLNWYGQFVCGIGAFGVKFPKSSTRDLTEAEAEHLSTKSFRLADLRWSYTKDELLNKGSPASSAVLRHGGPRHA
jgi:hypothetical protein